MSYILLLVFSAVNLLPKSFSISEFQTKLACEIALKESKKFYKTVDYESRCISVEAEIKKEKAKQDLKELENNQ